MAGPPRYFFFSRFSRAAEKNNIATESKKRAACFFQSLYSPRKIIFNTVVETCTESKVLTLYKAFYYPHPIEIGFLIDNGWGNISSIIRFEKGHFFISLSINVSMGEYFSLTLLNVRKVLSTYTSKSGQVRSLTVFNIPSANL